MKRMIWVILGIVLLGVLFFIYRFVGQTILAPYFGLELPFTITHHYATISDAVANNDLSEVRRLIGEGADVNAPDFRGDAPLLVAVGSNQFQIAEVLIQHGANIWAYESLGFTVGNLSKYDRVGTSSPEGKARLRVIEELKAKGFPFPGPDSKQIEQMVKAGTWPPKR